MSNTLISIRPAQYSDLPDVAQIDFAAFSPYGTEESAEIFEKRLRTFPEGFVVAEQNETIVGYGTSEKWLVDREPELDEDPSLTHHSDGRIFCITAMAVDLDYWRRGIGSLILEALLSIAKHHGCEKVVLETTHAQGLYEKHGFSTVAERTQRDVSLSIMELELNSHS